MTPTVEGFVFALMGAAEPKYAAANFYVPSGSASCRTHMMAIDPRSGDCIFCVDCADSSSAVFYRVRHDEMCIDFLFTDEHAYQSVKKIVVTHSGTIWYWCDVDDGFIKKWTAFGGLEFGYEMTTTESGLEVSDFVAWRDSTTNADRLVILAQDTDTDYETIVAEINLDDVGEDVAGADTGAFNIQWDTDTSMSNVGMIYDSVNNRIVIAGKDAGIAASDFCIITLNPDVTDNTAFDDDRYISSITVTEPSDYVQQCLAYDSLNDEYVVGFNTGSNFYLARVASDFSAIDDRTINWTTGVAIDVDDLGNVYAWNRNGDNEVISIDDSWSARWQGVLATTGISASYIRDMRVNDRGQVFLLIENDDTLDWTTLLVLDASGPTGFESTVTDPNGSTAEIDFDSDTAATISAAAGSLGAVSNTYNQSLINTFMLDVSPNENDTTTEHSILSEVV